MGKILPSLPSLYTCYILVDSTRGGGSCASSTYTHRTAGLISADTWQHVAVTVDKTAEVSRQVNIYIDGVDQTNASTAVASPRRGSFADGALLGGAQRTTSTTASAAKQQLLTVGASGSSSCAAELASSCASCGCFAGRGLLQSICSRKNRAMRKK